MFYNKSCIIIFKLDTLTIEFGQKLKTFTLVTCELGLTSGYIMYLKSDLHRNRAVYGINDTVDLEGK